MSTSTIVLLIYILFLVPSMLLGFGFARRKLFRPHHKLIMTGITLINWVLIIVVMIGSYGNNVAPYLSTGIEQPSLLLPTLHLITGATAQFLATYLVTLMWFEKSLPKFLVTHKIKTPMRITLSLWLITALLGIGIYLVWNAPASAEDVLSPVSTDEAPVSTDEAPVDGTAEPVATEEMVVDSTAEPVATEEMVVDSTAEPVATEEISADSTAEPVATEEMVVDSTVEPVATDIVEAVSTPESDLSILLRNPQARREQAISRWMLVASRLVTVAPVSTPDSVIAPVSTPDVQPVATDDSGGNDNGGDDSGGDDNGGDDDKKDDDKKDD